MLGGYKDDTGEGGDNRLFTRKERLHVVSDIQDLVLMLIREKGLVVHLSV